MDLIIGVGEVGEALKTLFNECGHSICGYDLDPNRRFGEIESQDIALMHVCFPFSSHFIDSTSRYIERWQPKSVVIHSTVKPGTTKQLHDNLPNSNIVYSPIRGIHARLVFDLKRYTKYYSSYPKTDERLFQECFHSSCRLKIERYSTPFALETAKIVIGSSYYGWIIVYGQLVDKICFKHGLEYDELWKFAEEIHRYLGNRPKVYVDPAGIGGHCILQNIDLIEEHLPELKTTITTINEETKRRYSSSMNLNNQQ